MELINRIERARAREELLTVDEATRFFRVSKPTLLGALKRGEIIGFKIGRKWRIFKYPPREGLNFPSASSLIVDAALENAGKNR